MSHLLIVSVICPDREGLIAALSERLFEMGANLGDASFSVLGKGAEFTAVCEVPAAVTAEEVETALTGLPQTRDGHVAVRAFGYDPDHSESGRITHTIEVGGGDRPGLVARLAEVFQEYGANIVRLNCVKSGQGRDTRYAVRLSVHVPEGVRESCLNTVANTAGELTLSCRIDPV